MGIPGYDGQAGNYDARVGMGDEIARQVAKGLFSMEGVLPSARVLDVGCGTGEIGQFIAGRAQAYTGIDRSTAMLAEFEQRLGAPAAGVSLSQVDANQRWPISDQSIDVLFSSRALHLLELSHVMAEIKRVAAPSGLRCVIGRVSRDKKGVAQTMRRQMREILGQHGIKGRSGKRNLDGIRKCSQDAGAQDMGCTVVASWPVSESPQHSLDNWRGKAGLAGIDVSDEVRLAVLNELQQWAADQYGSIQFEQESTSRYELHGFYFS